MSVYYAASQAEALLCAGDPVAVVGGGNSAGQAAVFLSRHAAQVTLIVREHDLSESMSRYLIDQLERIPNVRIMLVAEVREHPQTGQVHRPAAGAAGTPRDARRTGSAAVRLRRAG
jgi:thioredoxin reductase